MASLTIRNLDEEVKQKLRVRGALRGTSMEDEARCILKAAVTSDMPLEAIGAPQPDPPAPQESAWDMIKRLREKHGTFELEIPPRTDMVGDSLKKSD